MTDYSEARQILLEAQREGEVLTTLGDIELPPGKYSEETGNWEEEHPTVRVVVKGDGGKPVAMAGSLEAVNNDPVYGGALLHIGGGFSDFQLECPALLVGVSVETDPYGDEQDEPNDQCPIHLSLACYCREGDFDAPPPLFK